MEHVRHSSAVVRQKLPLGACMVLSSHNTYIQSIAQFGWWHIRSQFDNYRSISTWPTTFHLKPSCWWFVHTSDPLFISVQTNLFDIDDYDRLADLWQTVFTSRLTNVSVDGQTCMYSLRDRIILMNEYTRGRFRSLVNLNWEDHINLPWNDQKLLSSTSRIRRVYPRATLLSQLFSINEAMSRYVCAGVQFIAMNFNHDDVNLGAHCELFHIDGIVQELFYDTVYTTHVSITNY